MIVPFFSKWSSHEGDVDGKPLEVGGFGLKKYHLSGNDLALSGLVSLSLCQSPTLMICSVGISASGRLVTYGVIPGYLT
jgi:hypothetical protein